MKNIAWLDGRICDLSDAKVPLEDRGYLYGDGVYEVTRIYNKRPFYLEAHLDRLQKSASGIRIVLPFDLEEIKRVVFDLIKRSGCEEGYIYMQITRGSAKRDHLFPEKARPSMTMYIRSLSAPQAVDDIEAKHCVTLPDERWPNCHIKSVNLLPNVLARQKAADNGAIEALLYRPDGTVTEGTRSNVFAVIAGAVRTHPLAPHILAGITRGIVLDILKEQSIDCFEEAFTLEQLKSASEVWITSTTMEVNPVATVDDFKTVEAAPGPIWRLVMTEYRTKIAANGGDQD